MSEFPSKCAFVLTNLPLYHAHDPDFNYELTRLMFRARSVSPRISASDRRMLKLSQLLTSLLGSLFAIIRDALRFYGPANAGFYFSPPHLQDGTYIRSDKGQLPVLLSIICSPKERRPNLRQSN